MNIIFNELARDELNDAVDFYNLELSGLGVFFKEEIKKSLNRILDYPAAWPAITQDIRKYVLHRFPYKILYSIEKDHIYIIAIAHQHRKPNYWIDRYLKNNLL